MSKYVIYPITRQGLYRMPFTGELLSPKSPATGNDLSAQALPCDSPGMSDKISFFVIIEYYYIQ